VYSGAASDKLSNSTRAVCEAGCFVILQKLNASRWPCQPMHKRTGLLLLSDCRRDVTSVNSGICFFSFCGSLLSLGT